MFFVGIYRVFNNGLETCKEVPGQVPSFIQSDSYESVKDVLYNNDHRTEMLECIVRAENNDDLIAKVKTMKAALDCPYR